MNNLVDNLAKKHNTAQAGGRLHSAKLDAVSAETFSTNLGQPAYILVQQNAQLRVLCMINQRLFTST